MASLTGTKIKDTYDSLLKVSDNGALDGTLQTITDGLGNNSALSLSTAGASVGGTLAVSGAATFSGALNGTLSTAAQTNITSVGTLSSLNVSGLAAIGGTGVANYPLTLRSKSGDYTKILDWGTDAGGSWGNMTINLDSPYQTIMRSGSWQFNQGSTEAMRIHSGGDISFRDSSANEAFYWDASAASLGIGVSPLSKLHISGQSGTTGLPSLLLYGESGASGQRYGLNVSVDALDISALGTSAGIKFYTGGNAGSITERMRITSSGNVGIGETNPASKLHIQSSASGGQNIRVVTSLAAGRNYMQWANGSGDMGYIGYGGSDSKFYINNQLNDDMLFATNGAERMRILSSGGLTFNGDTSSANALDDYEEGTFTATLRGSVSDPSTAVTATGLYTKIGRQVQVNVYFENVNTTGASGDLYVTGLPFTASGSIGRYVGSVASFNFTFAGTSNCTFMGAGSSSFEVLSSVSNGAWSNMTHATTGPSRYISFSFTYYS